MTSRTRHTTGRARAAFTLPELLVVVTVTLILMSILVQATSVITSTISSAKAQGDFVGQERAALAVLARDLQRDHFLDEDGKPNGGRRLSDQRTDQSGAGRPYVPPKAGYFWARSRPAEPNPLAVYDPLNDATWNFQEGRDAEGFQSSRSGDHFLQFTTVVAPGKPEDAVMADVPYKNNPVTTAYPIFGSCAEVAYFLVPNGRTPNGVAKFKLVRRQRLAARNEDDKPAYAALLLSPPPGNPQVQAIDSSEVMAVNSGTNVLNLADLAKLDNRLGGVPSTHPNYPLQKRAPVENFRIGEDVLHHHVTSFEVKFTGPQALNVSWPNAADMPQWPRPFFHPSDPTRNNSDYPYDNLPFNGEFDTTDPTNTSYATATTLNGRLKPIRITGAQIRLRCWNPSTKTTRQSTVAVDL